MATTKITKTTTGNYDQIFALSQGYLNKSFQQLWKKTPETLGLHKFVVSNIIGKIDAEIGAPEIEVDISPSDKFVLFNINIISGKFQLRDSDTGDFVDGMPDGGFDMAGRRIAFKVGIAAEALDLHDAAHQDIIKQLHEDASNYSLSRLYMDLTSADLSTFNGDGSKLPDEVLKSNSNWTMFFSTWMSKAHHNKVNTLGYTLNALDAASKPKTIDPTFLPTFNQFQTCEWQDSSGKAKQILPDGDNNCLLYLQMTKGNDVPQDLHYNYTGNMVDAGESGTLFISRKLFWDTWLIPQLRTINYRTYLLANGTHAGGNEINPDFGWDYRIGEDAAKAKGRNEQDRFYDFNAFDAQAHGYSWAPGSTQDESHAGIWGSELKAVLECDTQNSITFTPGTNKIHFSSRIHSWLQRWTTAGGSGSADITSDWSFDLEMTQITSTAETNQDLVPGGLLIKLIDPADANVRVDAHGSDWGGGMSAPDGAGDAIRGAIKGLDLQSLAKNVEKGLSGLGHFILPGNGTFSMSSPTFNNNGDFLCHLDYLPSETGGSS